MKTYTAAQKTQCINDDVQRMVIQVLTKAGIDITMRELRAYRK